MRIKLIISKATIITLKNLILCSIFCTMVQVLAIASYIQTNLGIACMTDGFNRYWPTMIRHAGNCTQQIAQIFSVKSEVLQVFNKPKPDCEKNYVRRGILYIILFIIGSGFLFLFSYSLSCFATKCARHNDDTVIYKPHKYRLETRNILNSVTFENTLYCNISRCKTVVCSSIPAPLDSGKEASYFLENIFKSQCSTSKKVKTLIFKNCNFPGNILGPAWLKTNLSIDTLSFRNCQLEKIDDHAFSLHFYTDLKTLSVTENNISILRKTMFEKLVNLQSLMIHNNVITFAESNLLENSADSLQTLELDSSIKNVEVVENITGHSSLPKIEILSIQGNSLPILTCDLFKGVPNVKSIYIDNSRIEDVMIDAFQPMAHSIEQLFMRSNYITALKKGVLDTILDNKSNFGLNIDGNPWHCDCSMKWMQNLMQKHPDIVVNDPICKTPQKNTGVSFTKANFCNGSEHLSSTVSSSTTEDDTESVKLNITCDTILRWLYEEYSYESLLSIKYQFTKLRHFLISEMTNGNILVNFTSAKSGFTLIWFSNEDLMLNSENIKNHVKCINSLSNTVILKKLKPATSYTVCLLEAEATRPSPLNCLALFTSAEYLSRVWLSNGDKPLVISLFTMMLFIFSLSSAIISYIVIRRNPTLLRGSKRVLIVRRRRMNVVVLPQGVQINSRRNTESHGTVSNLEDHDYLTPLGFSQKGRKDSQRSTASSQSSEASYISGIEPNLLQLATWRIHRLRNINSQEVEETPPIPPNHPVDIPTMSYDVV